MRRLAIFLDGTWNTLNNNTNVWRLKSLTAETGNQRLSTTARVSAPGAARPPAAASPATASTTRSSKPTLGSSRTSPMATKYSSWDTSRGAYTARSLSGLICKCGVLKLGAPLSIEQLYARYRLYDAPTIRTLIANGLPNDRYYRGAVVGQILLARRRSSSSASGIPSAL